MVMFKKINTLSKMEEIYYEMDIDYITEEQYEFSVKKTQTDYSAERSNFGKISEISLFFCIISFAAYLSSKDINMFQSYNSFLHVFILFIIALITYGLIAIIYFAYVIGCDDSQFYIEHKRKASIELQASEILEYRYQPSSKILIISVKLSSNKIKKMQFYILYCVVDPILKKPLFDLKDDILYLPFSESLEETEKLREVQHLN